MLRVFNHDALVNQYPPVISDVSVDHVKVGPSVGLLQLEVRS